MQTHRRSCRPGTQRCRPRAKCPAFPMVRCVDNAASSADHGGSNLPPHCLLQRASLRHALHGVCWWATVWVPSASGANEAPQHQGGTHDRWVYPSEQQFYNAMRRKGWPADPGDMSNVVAIHNGVNERAWHQILKYEVRRRGACPSAAIERRWQRGKHSSPVQLCLAETHQGRASYKRAYMRADLSCALSILCTSGLQSMCLVASAW